MPRKGGLTKKWQIRKKIRITLLTIPNNNKLNKLNLHRIYSFSTKKSLLLRPKIFLENKKIKNEITRK